MYHADTILAVASAPGVSSRAIIRVSGVGVADLCERILTDPVLTSPDRRGSVSPARSSVFKAVLSLFGLPSLPILAMRFFAPSSYTGEDVLEFQVPGNPHLIERVVRGILSQREESEKPSLTVGARQISIRLAHPGEFTARAYFNRKLTLEQAEGVAATIAARTKEQLEASRQLLDGHTGQRYRDLTDECETLLALVESGIDFADQEDVVPIAPPRLRHRLEKLHGSIASFLAGEGSKEREHALPLVAIVGRPNAGKSTLFNALLGRERAVASPVSGTTRDMLAEALDLSKDAPGSGEIMLMDLPGLDPLPSQPRGTSVPPVPASAPVPSAPAHLAQLSARDAIDRADAILWCDPAGRFDSETELSALGLSREQLSQQPTLRVRTFGDQVGLGPSQGNDEPSTISVCAIDGWNFSTLRRALADMACSAAAGQLAVLLPRHRLALRRSATLIGEATQAVDPTAHSLTSPELVADSLRSALDSLGELVGHISPDDVLGRVFSTFCVGK